MKKIYLIRFLDKSRDVWEIDAAALTRDDAEDYRKLLLERHPSISTNIIPIPLHEGRGD